MKDPFYITTPIYYVNDIPHIGHAYTSVAADILARFARLESRSVRFLTGTDEHGQKVEKSAQTKGLSPQAFVDQVTQKFRDLCHTLNLSQDHFIRTTDPDHLKAAQAFWTRLQDKGYIYKSTYAGWYSVRDEAFYQESELKEGKAPTGSEVNWVEEPTYFFKLSSLEDRLLDFYHKHPDFIGPEGRKNEVISFVKRGLRDLAISRSSFSWGIPVPGDEDHVMYVWVEALVNYITALGYPETSDEAFQNFWENSVHLVGKDILIFHAVYWPALLMAADLSPPKRIFAHGWWTVEGEKMSKSLGNTIDPFECVAEFGADQFRYFLARHIPFGNDGNFSRQAFIHHLNCDLSNDFGNLIQRVMSFIYKHCDQRIPQPGSLTSEDQAFLEKIRGMPEAIIPFFETQQIHKICDEIWKGVTAANQYVDLQAPWALRKTDTDRMQTVLFVLASAIHDLAILLSPIMPSSCQTIGALFQSDDLSFSKLSTLTPGIEIEKPVGIFPRQTAETL